MIRTFCKKIIGIVLVAAMIVGNTPTDVYAAKSVASDDTVKGVSSEVISSDFDESDISEEKDDEGNAKNEKSDSVEPTEVILKDPFEEGRKKLLELEVADDNGGMYNYKPDASDYTSYSIYDNLSDSEEISAKRYYESLPSKFDIRDEIEIPAIRNQNPYGSCWAHSAMALAEINLIKKGLADKNINLSEMQTAVFAYTDVKDPLNGFFSDSLTYLGHESYVDVGGNINFAKRYLAAWKGSANEEDVPYGLGEEFQSQIADTTKLAYEYDSVHVQGYKNADIVNQREAVKKLIMEYGAVSASYYEKSVYYNSEYNSYFNPISNDTNHAITVIGWDDNFPKENFNTIASENGAWLIRNSWGLNGDDHSGYFWLSYVDASLAENVVAIDVECADNYDNNYQYDGGFGEGSLNIGTPCIYGANIFTAHASDNDPRIISEILKAVSFVTCSSNLDYEVMVYTDVTDSSDPVSGTLADTVKGKTDYVGYYTVPLTKEVSIEEGSDYSVVIKLSSQDGSDVSFSFDTDYKIKDVVKTESKANVGESFYSEESDTGFMDCSGLNNVNIKAFTDNVYSNTKYKINYVINRNGNFGINSNNNPLYYYKTDKDIDLDLPQERYNDISFGGWYTDKELKNEVGEISSGSTGDVTLYAKWNMPSYITGDCIATLDQNGVLTVSGSGVTGNYTEKKQPWYEKENLIKEIIFEDGVTEIGDYFAASLSKVERIVIPESVTNIGTCAFVRCSNLNTIEYNAVNASGQNIAYYGWEGSAKSHNRTLVIGKDVEEIGVNMFSGAQLCNIIWPDKCKVTTIGDWAFRDEQYYDEIDIPESVTYIGEMAFYENDNLTSINFYGTPTIKKNAFYASTNVNTDININGSDAFARSYDWAGSNRTVQYNNLQYKINYNLDGGTNNADNPNYYNGLSTIILKNPSKKGYIFDGFYESADFSGVKVAAIVAGTNRNITLYAKWVKCDHSKSSTSPTCSKSAICSVCGEEIPPTGIHALSDWTQTKAPTCIKAGEKEKHCTNAGCTFSETDTVAPTGIHALSAWTQTKAPTCIKAGEKERHCTNAGCTFSETDTVAATGIHALSEWKETKAPTCIKAGEKERHCTNAGCTYSETDTVAATGIHTLSAWTQTKAPTCIKAGEKERHCTNADCTYNETDTVAATGIHALSEWKETKAPTCSVAGEKERHCTNTGCTYSETDTVAATGIHALTEWKVTKTPTCSVAGEKERHCTNTGCTYSETDTIKATGHSLTEWKETKAPTCTEVGEKERHCTNTGCTYSETDTIKATGHSLTEWKETKAPTCTEVGEKERHCTNTGCTYSETDTIKAIGHSLTEWKETKAPTCTEVGEKERHCTNTGCTYSETDTIKAIGHSLTEWKITKNPTCTESGEKERHCTRTGCTYNITEIIDPVSEGFQVVLENEDVDYNPKGAQPKFTVYFNGDILTPTVDYKVTYKNNKKAASKDSLQPPTIVITGAGRFTKSYTAKYTINQVDLNDLSYTEIITTTKKTALKIPVYNDGVLLKNTDYDVFKLVNEEEVKVKSNEKLQESCTLLVRGKEKGNYKGEIKIAVNVVETLGNKVAVNASTSKIYYDGTKFFPEITVYDSKDKNNILEENTDYVVHYPVDMISAGSKTYIVEGIGDYSGTVTKKYTISPVILAADDLDITYDDEDLFFDTNGTTLNDISVSAIVDGNSVELTEGIDYTVKYASNKKATTLTSKAKCTISFIGNYKGTKSKQITYDILKKSLSDAKVIVTDKLKCSPKGGVLKSTPIVNVDGVKIANSNYTVTYYVGDEMQEMSSKNPVVFDDDGVETIYVKIEGKGNYEDEVNETVSYKVYSKNFDAEDMVDLSKAAIIIDAKSYNPEYDGYEKKPEISVTVNSNPVASEDYICYYSNNVLKGTATIIINGDGISTFGTKSKTFAIKAKTINN